jgi:osmotically-inducible protein OsmY
MTLNRSFAVLVLVASLAGGVLAQGKVVANDDESIFTAVESVLQRSRSLKAARIEVHSREGFVTLTGFAATVEDVATAGRLAATVHGVTGVSNQIRVADRASRA